MTTYVIVAVTAYLLGSIPFGYILVRIFRKQDVRTIGSGNIGATNVARSGAKGLGIATLILDATKGFLAVKLAQFLGTYLLRTGMQEEWDVLSVPARHQLIWLHFSKFMALAAVFAIIGHMYPVWLKFKGGKGVATGVGVFLALAPKAVGLVLIIFIAIVWVSRYVSLGSIVATATFPVLAWLLYRETEAPVVFLAAAIAAFMIIAKHHQNIRRLLNGTESKFGVKKQTEAQA
jgi:acyl phosphate:glycerol-3-phosphate acyltransferase